MPVKPRIKVSKDVGTKTCTKCSITQGVASFARTHNGFYPDGRLPICNDCATAFLKENDFSWEAIDHLCMWADIPFIIKEWNRLLELNDENSIWEVYARVFAEDDYINLGWSDYYKQYKRLKEVGLIEEELPEIREQKYIDLRKKWGGNYSDEQLNYLEDLYKGLMVTQNVNGALQIDQAQKLCKISLEVDSRIRAGDKDVDKFLASYDRLVKIAEFTPKNTKNAANFDSIAELAVWMEKKGKINKFYDGATRDVIDETLKNIETYNQRLYINEGGIGEEITNRLDALKSANTYESPEEQIYDIQQDFEEDEYENEGFNPTGGE